MSVLRFEGASYSLRAARAFFNEPIVTGSLLYILTLGPVHIRERLLRPFRNNLLATNGASRLTTVVAVLKAFFVLGVISRINKALNRFALNGWAFKRQGAQFEFGPEKKEVVVITGGSSGFGYEMVKAFSKIATVVAFDVNALPAELANLPGVHHYHLDISNNEHLQQVCADVKNVHGDPTVLINNAGIANGRPILQTTNEATEKIFKINVIAHFALIREFLPGMLSKRKGHIVSIASMLSFVSPRNLVDYACTKVGALYLTEGLRSECLHVYPGGESICTTSVHPGWYSTGIIRGAEDSLAKQGIVPRSPVEVAEKIVEQVVKGRSGRLVVPEEGERWCGVRTWPVWVQDVVGGVVGRRKLGGVEKEG